MDMQSPNVVSLLDARQSRAETGAPAEQVSKPAHAQLLPFPKAAHVRHPKAQRVAGLRGRTLMDAVDKRMSEEAAPIPLADRQRIDGLIDDALAERGIEVPGSIAHNERLRAERRTAWDRAEATSCYWEASQRFLFATRIGQREGVAAARDHDPVELETYTDAYRCYREALLAHLLTPAPDVASNEWKMRRMTAKRREHWDSATEEAVRTLINDDLEWLEAHPARQRRSR